MDADPGFWHTITTSLWAIVVAGGGWAWKHTQKRIGDHELRLLALHDSKADASALTRSNDHIAKIFDQLSEIRSEISAAHTALQSNMHAQHIALLDKINAPRARR